MRSAMALTAVLLAFCATSAFADGDAVLGKRQFAVCSACHTLEKGGPSKIGPNLYGVIGRKSGTFPGFSYSAAMPKANVVWDEQALDKYLTKPQDFIPGNKMAYIGIPKPDVRANVIAYLKEAAK